MLRPVIGITTSRDRVRFGAWNTDVAFVPLAYVRAVERSGGRPLLVPPSEEGVDETLGAIDALVVSGGEDVDPAAYGAERHPETKVVRPDRDRGELALLEAALARNMPVLAICRGMEILNVARGGDLVQHLPDVVGHDGHRHTPGVFADHHVELAPGSRLRAIVRDRSPVKSHHHQALGRLGGGLVDVAWAEDGTVEAIEDPSRRFTLGVLWHPEEGEDLALFAALVEAAGAYRDERR